MSFFQEDDSVGSNVPKNPNIKPEPFQHVAVDTKYEPRRMLITHVQGSKWVVRFYSQYVTPDSELAAQEINRPEVYQQYLKIIDMELRVTQPLQQTQNSSNKEFELRGSATVFPGITVNKGDMFVADVGDGREGLFVVETVEQRSILRDTTYTIEYNLKDYLNQTDHQDLEAKVVKTKFFVKDFYAFGKKPLLVQSEYDHYRKIQEWMLELPNIYYGHFFNAEYNTFLVPDQPWTVYDPFLTECMARIVPRSAFKRLRVLNRDDDTNADIKSLWEALETLSVKTMDFAPIKFEVRDMLKFSAIPRHSSVRFSGITYVYYPIGDDDTPLDRLVPSEERVFRRPQALSDILNEALEGLSYLGIETTPSTALKPVTIDDYYVFSEAFYKHVVEDMSLLELMVHRMLERKPIGIEQLLKLCESSIYWGKVEQYYYIPVLIMLLRSAVGDIN